uniref:Uncharacterized protein n=1 Tax=Cacopsylla melanoneura TaxID=428564 RepID=A0A8D8TJP7_9HEMI
MCVKYQPQWDSCNNVGNLLDFEPGSWWFKPSVSIKFMVVANLLTHFEFLDQSVPVFLSLLPIPVKIAHTHSFVPTSLPLFSTQLDLLSLAWSSTIPSFLAPSLFSLLGLTYHPWLQAPPFLRSYLPPSFLY